MPPLTVSTDVRDGACVIRVDGDAGVANAERLDVELARACTRRPALAVVDLGGLTFISSMGMGALVHFHRAVVSHGGVVRFAAAQPLVADAFRRARLSDVLELHGTVHAALGKPSDSDADDDEDGVPSR